MDEFETSGEELEEERDGGRTSPSGKPRDEIIVKVIDCNKKENNDWVYDIEVSGEVGGAGINTAYAL